MLIGLGKIWDVAGDIMQANVISGYEPKLWGCLRFRNVAFTCVKKEKFGEMFKKIFVKCAMMHLSGLTSVHSSSFTFNSIKIQFLILTKVQ